MKIRILGWSCENIRQFRNMEFKMEDESGNIPHVYLVMMRNGTGKTTTTTLIRTVLSRGNLTEDDVMSFKPITYDCNYGKFTLTMKYDDARYYYVLNLNYVDGKYEYSTSRTGQSGGLETGRKVPTVLNVFDNEEFINRFIFDGEQAQLTLSTGNQEAEKAITYLYQVNELDNMIGRVEDIVKNKQRQSNNQGESKTSISNLRTRMISKHNKYQELLEHVNDLEKRQADLLKQKDSLEKKKNKLLEADERIREEKQKLEINKMALIESMKNQFRYIRTGFIMPYQIHDEFNNRLKNLSENMQILKLPKTTAKEFFIELSEKQKCICGNEIGDEQKQHILTNADKYLGAEELTVINAIKHALRNYEVTDDLQDNLYKLQKTKDELIILNGNIADLSSKLNPESMEKSDEITKKLRDIQNDSIIICDELKRLKAPATAAGATEENNIEAANSAYKASKKKYEEATGTYQFTKKAERMKTYILKIKALTLEKLKVNILEGVNRRIAQIIKNDDIVIEKIDGNIVLQKRKKVSEGQSLAVAYAYVGTLFEHSTHDFPFLVDSPAAKMDLDVRREVATVLPDLFHQLIIFVTSGETAGFADRFYCREDVKYVTMESEGNKYEKCTYGEDYFSRYQNEGTVESEVL